MRNTIEKSTRQVIERKLLTALEDKGTVAILASKQDLEDMIAALRGFEISVSTEAFRNRRKALAESLSELLHAAFL